jgi:acetolactate synthase-1/2/3 large subunit
VEQVKNSDLIVAIGPRLGDITSTEYSTLEVPDRSGCSEGQKLVHVHISADQVNAVFRADLGIVSQPQAFLQAANEIPAGSADRSKAIIHRHQDYLDFVTQPRNQEAALRMDKVSQFLRNRLDADAIITVGAGNFSTWAQRHYQYRKPNTFLGSTNGSMGYGVPSAIAAKLAKPDSVVVSFSGDGCYMMNGQELATAVQYHLNVIFLVINNGRYGTIRMHQERHYPGRISATQLQNPNFAALARAYGAFGTTVTETHQFEDAFEQALDAGKPALIELQIDYH